MGALLSILKREQQALAQQHGRHVPLAVKIAPDLTDAALRGIARLLVEHGVEGIIATNTTLARDQVAGLPHADEAGGLSGAPLRERATAVVRVLADELDGALPIIGVGGIGDVAAARERIAAGSSMAGRRSSPPARTRSADRSPPAARAIRRAAPP
jgi:dihydroorotate dehydrogenase